MLRTVFLAFSTTDTIRCLSMGHYQIIVIDGCAHAAELLIVIVQREIIRNGNVLRALVFTDAVAAGSTWNCSLRTNNLCHPLKRMPPSSVHHHIPLSLFLSSCGLPPCQKPFYLLFFPPSCKISSFFKFIGFIFLWNYLLERNGFMCILEFCLNVTF